MQSAYFFAANFIWSIVRTAPHSGVRTLHVHLVHVQQYKTKRSWLVNILIEAPFILPMFSVSLLQLHRIFFPSGVNRIFQSLCFHAKDLDRTQYTYLLNILFKYPLLQALLQPESLDLPQLVEVLFGSVHSVQKLGNLGHRALEISCSRNDKSTTLQNEKI